jgi:adenosyl cobinamide kinase/adenosyl cobinamide phosphate guanylyltransferase
LITLVLGGTRSGKSQVAEDLVARRQATVGGDVTFVATGQASDDDMAARIAAHRARRPSTWATVEPVADLPAALAGLTGHVLVDSLGTWVASDPGLAPDVPGLCAALGARARHGGGDTVLVSEEVGLGVHAATEVGRRFADALGELNRAVADVADRALLVVAGRVLPLDPLAGPG